MDSSVVFSKNDSYQRRKIIVIQRTKTRISKTFPINPTEFLINIQCLQMEEVKNKETYAVAKNLLEKYGGNLTPNVRPSIVNDANKNSDLHQRISIKPNSTPVSNGNQTPVRLPLNRLAGR